MMWEVLSTGDIGDSQADSPDSLSQQSRSHRRVCKKAPPPPPVADLTPDPQEDAARQTISSGGDPIDPIFRLS